MAWDAHILLPAAIALVAGQRLMELRLSRRNEAWLRSRGATEGGRHIYPFIILFHTLFFIALAFEGWWRGPVLSPAWGLWLGLFLTAQAVRVWTMRTLGPLWCTRLLVVPGMELATGGPYKYLRHPNYLVVAVELLSLPLMFGAYATALAASAANALFLSLRMREEERLLRRLTAYDELFGERPRLLPRRPAS